MPNHNENLEQLLDLIAEHLIQSNLVNSSIVKDSQKYIRNGTLQPGAGGGVLALFQKDIKANQEDLNNTVLNNAEVEQNLIEIASNITPKIFSIIPIPFFPKKL